MRIDELDTPVLDCDLDVLERNIQQTADLCRRLGIPLRVHSKSHKIPEIAHWQMDAGATGICCQKVGEAEVMVAAGIRDILIPYNIVGAAKVDRLLRLARRATMTVAVDSLETAQGLSAGAAQIAGRVRVLIELDTGGRRCGVQSPAAAQDLARQIVGLPGVDLQGVLTYPSRREAKPFLDETVARLRQDGIAVHVVSGGGTGHEAISQEIGCTETRSGSYIWEGLTRVHGRDDLDSNRCPLRVVTTVVSVPAPGRVIVDGGMKTFTSYPPIPYGLCLEYPELHIVGMSVEHGHIDSRASTHRFRVGERLSFIPLHGGLTTNLHDKMVGVRGEQVEVVWEVAGRGKIR